MLKMATFRDALTMWSTLKQLAQADFKFTASAASKRFLKIEVSI